MNKLLLLLALSILVLGCTGLNNSANGGQNNTEGETTMTVQKGDVVKVDYVGTLDDGTVFDTSLRDAAQKAGLPLRPSYAPLEFTVGAGQMIAGFDSGVVGMKEGEEKTVILPPDQAYGEVRQDLIMVADLGMFTSQGQSPSVGGYVQGDNGAVGTITSIEGSNVTIDFNHNLAGKQLTFKITLKKIIRG